MSVGGAERGPALQPADFTTAASVRDVYIKVEAYLCKFLSQLDDYDLDRMIHFTNPRGEKRSMPLGELMQHAAIHGVHHRGQVLIGRSVAKTGRLILLCSLLLSRDSGRVAEFIAIIREHLPASSHA